MSINRFYPHHRFIPAYAGNSPFIDVSDCGPPVHPRLRGELIKGSSNITNVAGSSPLTRGTQWQGVLSDVPFRFIPAYAGNSSCLLHWRPEPPVHPRLRGELFLWIRSSRRHHGSSPLTRGTRNHAVGRVKLARFIPAYAGNSTRKHSFLLM